MSYGKRKKPRPPIYDESLGIPPTEDEIVAMNRQAHNVLDYWLTLSDRSRKELRDKLKKKGLPDFIIEENLDKYEDLGYIDDERFANNFVDSKVRYDRLGKRAISMKLREKGISSHLIEAAISTIDDYVEEEQALEIALTKARQNRRYDDTKRIQQIAGLLARKGYSGSSIFDIAKKAVNMVKDEDEEN